jgi:rRNA pseudouridine-1189 N-methylase Emg1 (Nep1/Mra1 family)
MEAVKAAIEAYKKAKHEKKLKSRLIRKDLDYTYLEKLLNSLADNQNKLMIVIKLANGTQLEIKRQEKSASAMRDPYCEEIK